MLTELFTTIKTYLSLLMITIQDITGNDPMMSAALLVIITTATTGTFYYITKVLPRRIWMFIKRRYIITVSITNIRNEAYIYSKLQGLLVDATNHRGSRHYSIKRTSSGTTGASEFQKTIGFGKHYVRLEGKWLIVVFKRLQSEGTDIDKREMSIKYIGTSTDWLDKLLSTMGNQLGEDEISMYKLSPNGRWMPDSPIRTVSMEKLALNDSTRTEIISRTESYIQKERMYEHLNIPHRLTVMLHGQPGTGKTAMIRAIALKYKRNVCVVNACNGTDLLEVLSHLPRNAMVIIEDFDSIGSVQDRSITSHSESYVSLANILNAMDGIKSLNGVMLFLSTNCLDKIDPAIFRPGRVDYLLELPKLEPLAVQRHLEHYFPELKDSVVNYTAMNGCNLHDIKVKTLANPDKLIEYIEEY